MAGVIGLVPITPGGIGIVEASLAGFLVLAGLDGAQAVLATLAYRLASYWLPHAGRARSPTPPSAPLPRPRTPPPVGHAAGTAAGLTRRPGRAPDAAVPYQREVDLAVGPRGCRAGRTPPR